jgi:hypothetical protein
MQIDFSARGQGRWNVMWRRLLWPGKPRWIVISYFPLQPERRAKI